MSWVETTNSLGSFSENPRQWPLKKVPFIYDAALPQTSFSFSKMEFSWSNVTAWRLQPKNKQQTVIPVRRHHVMYSFAGGDHLPG